jgi:hypothetical protein
MCATLVDMSKADRVTKELLTRLYTEDRMPTEKIGAELGMSGRYIRMLLKKFGIETLDRNKEHAERLRQVGAGSRFDGTANVGRRFTKGGPGWSRGLTKETSPIVAVIAAKKIGAKRPDIAKEKHFNWKGGSDAARRGARALPEYAEWRRAVFERDDYTCRTCGARGVRLEAHHIKPYASHPELRLDVSNGIALCKGCHRNLPHGPRTKRRHAKVTERQEPET